MAVGDGSSGKARRGAWTWLQGQQEPLQIWGHEARGTTLPFRNLAAMGRCFGGRGLTQMGLKSEGRLRKGKQGVQTTP